MNKNENLFLQASRKKTRILTGRGMLSTEELWDLSLKALDSIAVELHESIEKESRKSFLENPDKRASQARQDREDALEIIKVIIETKQDENKEHLAARTIEKQRDFLNDLKQKRQLEEMEGLSMEDIDKQLAELDG